MHPNEPKKKELLDNFFANLNEEEKQTRATWSLFYNFIHDFEHPYFQYVVANKSAFENKFGKEGVQYKLNTAFETYIDKYASDPEKMEVVMRIDSSQCKHLILKKNFRDASKAIRQDTSNLQKWKQFLLATKEYVKPLNQTDWELNDASWFIYENYKTFNDIAALKQAKEWSKKTIEVSPDNPAFNDTYAHILFDLGYTEQAIKYQQIALSKNVDEIDKDYLIRELNTFKNSLKTE